MVGVDLEINFSGISIRWFGWFGTMRGRLSENSLFRAQRQLRVETNKPNVTGKWTDKVVHKFEFNI